MRLIIVASLAVAIGGCLSVPVTPTAANDEACLDRVMNKYGESTKCESMRATRNRVGYQGSTRNKVGNGG